MKRKYIMSKSAVAVTSNNLVASTDNYQHTLKVSKGGRGNENVGQNVQIPRSQALQKMSNEVDKHHAATSKVASQGIWLTL